MNTSNYEQILEIDAVGGTTDVLVATDGPDTVSLSITDPEGEVVVVLMDESDARQLQHTLLAAINSLGQIGGAA